MQLEKSYDVVIVGAGPGGSITARDCAKAGLKVLLLEKRPEIGAPKRCAEGLGIAPLQRMGFTGKERFVAQRITSSSLFTPDGHEIEIPAGEGGYILERKVFDKWLACDAAKAGAKVLAKAEAVDLIRENNKICGIVADYNSEKISVRAKVVVAADGVESKIAKLAGLNTLSTPMNMASGYQYEMAGIEIPDPGRLYFYVGASLAPGGYCLTGDSQVMTKDSLKPISDIKAGEEVHNLLGWTRVSATSMREYNGKIVKVTPYMFNTEVGMTEDHLVYVWNKKQGFVWKKANDLVRGKRGGHRTGDHLIFPVPVAEPVKCVDFSEYFEGITEDGIIYPVGRNQFGAVFKYKHGLKQKLGLSMELMELFGYFISEGNANSSGIIISNTNTEIIKRIAEIGQNIFGFKPSIWFSKREKPCYQVNFASKILKSFFEKEFGVGCANKRIPKWFFGLPLEMKKAVLIGLFRGDGCKEDSSSGTASKYNLLSYISTSKQLIYDLWMLLSTMGIVGAIGRNKKKNAYRLRIRGGQLRELSDIFGICRHGSRPNKGFFIKDGIVFMGIRNIKTEEFSGKVYDIESGGSFCPGFIVHNCWIFPKGDHIANVGIGIIAKNDGKTAKDYLDKWIDSMPGLKKGSIIEENAGGIPLGNFLKKMTADNFLAVGDAAHQVNPIHGGGLAEATYAGALAAKIISRAIKDGDTSSKNLEEYNTLWWKERGEHLRKLEKIMGAFMKLSDEDINSIGGSLDGNGLARITDGDLAFCAKLLMKNPKLIGLAAKMV